PAKRPARRRTQAQRNQEMKQRLLGAAKAVLRDKGYAAFRVADVCDVAKVSKGALLHHFPTKDELIIGLVNDMYADQETETEIAATESESLTDLLDKLFQESMAFFFSETFAVSLNLTVGVAREPGLRETIFTIIGKFRRNKEAVWVKRFAAAGIPKKKAADAIYIANTTIRGLAVRGVWDENRKRMEEIQAKCKAMIFVSLTGS
ncbi:MAG: TetR/AcrR family transcriptional regulator, partial [Amphiplicatus sp.]